ncbi:MAG: PAS domain-containing protein [Desulfobacterales bacterium]|nr:PAS domain-containing protein [Desulfobacterales bacterium]MBF0398726.1 PAS domain-containing protein [Desulfobacterales bacterium]
MNKQISGDLAIKVLEQIPTPVMAVDTDLKVIFMNAAGCKFLGKSFDEIKSLYCYDLFNSLHCRTPECRMKKVMAGADICTVRNEVKINERTVYIEYTAAPLKDDQGNIIGGLEYVLDITERVRQEQKLREQSRTIMEISTPAIKLWDRIVVLPVVGVVDSVRAQQMMNTMLKKITETSSKVIILDIQGVAAVDTAVANHLIKIAKATKLMGCRCIISGISSAVAQTLVQLGIDLGAIITNSTLEDALSDAFTLLNLEVIKKK